MPWKYQYYIPSSYVRAGVTYPYQARMEWKYSETTPGYPSGKPYPSHNYYRGGAQLTPGSLNYQLYGLFNRKPAYWNFGGEYLPNPNIDWTGYRIGLIDNQSIAIAKAVASVNSKVRSAHFDVPVFLGEFGETCRLLARDANRIYEAAKAVKRGRWHDAARKLGIKPPKGVSMRRQFADNWLKYQFGYKPIVSDMVNSAKAFTKLGTRRSFVTVTGHGDAASRSTSPEIPFSVPGPLGGGDGTFVNKFNVRWECSIGYVIEITNPVLAELASLGITNPSSVAWELLPFSFVIDWFVNIGECLQYLDTWSGKRFVTGYQTDFVDLTVQGTIVKVPVCVAPEFYKLSGTGYDGQSFSISPLFDLHQYAVNRQTLGGPVPPRVRFDLPQSVWHFITEVSLLHKLFK